MGLYPWVMKHFLHAAVHSTPKLSFMAFSSSLLYLFGDSYRPFLPYSDNFGI
jgi:hypothetical protein